MELSPEEYGAYWGGAVRIAVGVLVVFFGYRFATPLLAISEFGATALGVVLFAGIVVAGCFIAVLGLARVVRAAVDAELRT
ncbi:hypothetical protein [Natronobeatus ordinarius]|uniref:hypothetical protein n=1 Tax=Natronobeatus ordinarius TaxID=2963433 RepID=UPI0020CE53C7|nr:hypothetical protein [Natronobeatus ordinarius]